MPRFAVPGADLAVELSDEGGPPVVQLHGLTSSRSRDRVLNLDLGRGLSGTRLLRYDARGHGGSSGRAVAEDYRWPSLADDLLRLMDHWFPGEQVHGVGPSMGAATLLHAAVRAPDRFSGLTLLVPPTAWETRPAKAEEYRKAALVVEEYGVEGFVTAGREQPRPPATADAPETRPDVPERLLPPVLRGAALSDLPGHDDIARLDIPTTVLAWIDDPSHPVSTARNLVELLPSATMEVASTPSEVLRWPDRLRDDVARI
ncbi:alpha/beta hydrolase [Aeromicrobium sp. PE09-221]|uniref:alpha/beta fold hydrolase n=1 Tax=Aeromicrobium sp. PE09-221 TaxID=1898043 RepID=UPI000B3E7072|nr:alpha/beta fold hydrolase [Aeromicrobium sp. PE09-221]OUZ12768.1 alpha/beta hydrolase [Aeromicrobium sp. PE09-221]